MDSTDEEEEFKEYDGERYHDFRTEEQRSGVAIMVGRLQGQQG